MEKFEIKVNGAEDVFYYEANFAARTLYLPGLENGELLAFFEPEEEEYLHISDNPGGLDEEVIYQIGLKIEAHTV